MSLTGGESLGGATGRDLTPLFEPRSVAVVGASNDATKWGGDVSVRLLRGEHRRRVYFVNGKGGQVLGRRAYASLRDLPEPAELVILAMSAGFLEQVIDDCVATGVRAVVGVTAMLGELGREGKAREARAAARLREAGALLVGPNCLGVADTSSELYGVAYLDVRAGPVGLITQSGGFGEELNLRFGEYGLGFSRFIALGNQADVTVADALRSFVGHGPTRAVVAYAEELHDGRAFAAAAGDLVAAGTPVVVLIPGRSEASARVARTHTGSLTSDTVVVDAACRASGALRVDTQRQAVELLVALLGSSRPHGRRVAVVSDGGGPGAIAADCLTLAGLSVPAFSVTTSRRLSAVLPDNAGCSNPVDFAAATYDPEAYERVLDVVLGSDEADAVLASGVIGFWGARFPEQADMVATERASLLRMADAVRRSGIPLVANTPEQCAVVDALRERGLPIYRDVESAVAVLARLADAEPALGVSPLPPRQEPVRAEGYWAARETLSAAGLPLVPARAVRDEDEAARAAAELGYPVVLKAAWLLHKSDAQGVALGLTDEDELRASLAAFRARFGDEHPFALEKMAVTPGVELLLGCRWDERFGPLLVVGMGGLLAELFRDVRAALAPLEDSKARRLLEGLRGAALFGPLRGRAAVDLTAAAGAAAALSRFAAAHPEVAAAEINPLLVTPQGAIGLDARLVRRD